MVLFSLQEIIDMAVMILAVGFIFKDSFIMPKKDYDPLLNPRGSFDSDAFKFAIIATAPAIALHELSHKFVALAAGIPATFHADYIWLGLGVIIKLLSFPFIFFVPGFVSTAGGAPIDRALISFAGPAVNLALWLGAEVLIRANKVNHRYLPIVFATKHINMFLFIFNMLPIPFLTDGWHFFYSLFQIFA